MFAITWKDISFGEVSYPTVRCSWFVLHTEVQVEPVGELNLEAHPDGVVPFLTGDMQDEPAAKARDTELRYIQANKHSSRSKKDREKLL